MSILELCLVLILCSELWSISHHLLPGFTKLSTLSLLFLSFLSIVARAIIPNLFSGFFLVNLRTVRLFNRVYRVHAFFYKFIYYVFFPLLQTFLQSLLLVLAKEKPLPLKALGLFSLSA